MNDRAVINRTAKIGDTTAVNAAFPRETIAPDSDLAQEIRAWLDRFAAAVRDVDYEMGRRLFAPDVMAFGTVGVMLNGLDALITSQWKQIWGVTSGFHYHMEHLSCGGAADLAWAAVPWTSWGRQPNGDAFPRHGRATYILQRRDGHWRAIHSHHSLEPHPRTSSDLS